MARIGGAPKAATGLSEAREAAGAIAEHRIACFCEAKATQNINLKKYGSLFSLFIIKIVYFFIYNRYKVFEEKKK